MHRIVPELIVENYRKGQFQGEFPALGMFLDLSGFSKMTDTLMQHGQHGAEVLAGLMHGVFDPLVESIFGYGGKIVSFAGDGILALYPVYGTPRDAALSALASAWGVQKNLLENPERSTLYGKFPLSVKIGLTLGSVSWRILRSRDEKQATYYFRGSAVDDSAHAEHCASAGDIMLTESLVNTLRNEIKVEPCDEYYRLVDFLVDAPPPETYALAPVDLEVSRIFMPEDVIVHDIRGEFRQIVNLFMSIPDVTDDQLTGFINTVFELRQRYGGLLTRIDFGDKGCNLLMLWGAPVAYENDVSRALSFILDLQERMDFPITTGVTYYIAHAGYLGSEMCEDYTCYGWGVNLASRFMMKAPNGAIWVDERVARKVSQRFEFEQLGSQRFKGFAAEQKVAELHRRKEEAGLNYQGEIVGREQEFARLRDFVAPLWDGKYAGVIGVSGDAGIGKGRLIDAFHDDIIFSGHTCLWVHLQADEVLKQSFKPVQRWLLRFFNLNDDDFVEVRQAAFDQKLDAMLASVSDEDLAQELNRTRSFLAALLDLHFQDSLYQILDAEGRYNNTILALIAFVKVASLRQPIILFVDDFHNIDHDSEKLFSKLKQSLIASTNPYPVGLILAYRKTGMDTQAAMDVVDVELALGGLAEKDITRLAETMLGGDVSRELVGLVKARSEGNPYFAEQVIRYLQDENLLEISSEGWRQVTRGRRILLPGDIRALLVARLDQLVHEVKSIVQTASVLGREFEVNVLSQMISMNENTYSLVSEAEKAAIWTSVKELRYIFHHALLRDAAYTMQMRARRKELHLLALSTLETIFTEIPESRYAELAHHAELGGHASKAREYFTRAGKTAALLYQNELAIDYFTHAIMHTPFDDLAGQFDLLVERIELFSRLGKRELQLTDLNTLDQLAKQLNDINRFAKVWMLYSSYFYFIGNYQESIQYARLAEDNPISPENIGLWHYTQVVWATALFRLGRFEDAMKQAQIGWERMRTAGDRKEESRVLNVLGLVALEQKQGALSLDYFKTALEIAREMKIIDTESKALNNLAMAEASINGNHALAYEYYEQALAITRKMGDRANESLMLGNLGFTAGMLGNFQIANSYHEQALHVSLETGNLVQEINTRINISAVSCLQGESDLALSQAQKATDLARGISYKSGEAWGTLYIGHAYILQNKLELARESYQKSVEIRNELNQPALSMEPIAGLVETYITENDLESASQYVDQIMQFIESGSSLDGADEPLRVYYSCYLYLERKKDLRSLQVLQIAKQLLDTQVSRFANVAERERYIENIPWRRAIWNKQS